MSRQMLSLRFVIIVFCLLIIRKMAYSDLCLLPVKTGFCRGIIPRWYYNFKTKTCSIFYWGGCAMGSNDNRFETQWDCNHQCKELLSCPKTYQALGCYENYFSGATKTTTKELLNVRDVRSKAFTGTLINWLYWSRYLPRMVCRCAKRAASNGYKFFFIQNVGECWGTNNYQAGMLNKTGQCWDRFYGQQCSSAGVTCAGGPSTSFYYKLAL